jgi:pyridine nucleotide-disulfide oxidoreductase family protein
MTMTGASSPARPRVVLVGMGHAHLFVLEAVRSGVLGDVELVVCTATAQHVYSGMLPGWLGGRYALDELSFDVAALVHAAGGSWVAHHVCAIDADARQVTLADGERVGYDVCSIAAGSTVAGASTPGVGEVAWAVKPLEQVVAFAEQLDELVRRSHGHIVVVGGGIAGVELALNAAARVRHLVKDTSRAPQISVSLVMHGEAVAADRGARASALAEQALRACGVRVWRGVRVEQVTAGEVHGHRGDDAVTVPADAVVWATGPAAPTWLSQGGLPLAADGYIAVDRSLRVSGTQWLFAAGDIATLVHAPDTPKAGVYAVRMGPHLVESLRHALGRGPAPRPFTPQRRWLSLMNVGDGTAIASWGPLALRAGWAMRLKDVIDRRFMGRFRI